MYHDLKAVLVHLARAFGMQHHRQINILEILDTACACRNEGLMQKGERGREIYQSLSKIGVIDSKEGDRLLEEEGKICAFYIHTKLTITIMVLFVHKLPKNYFI